ncbi:hypothetical protein JCM15754A_05980 [Prevotella aurantiaca JCM 15754]
MIDYKEQHKNSIRFFNDREIKAVWGKEQNCWWILATDIVRAINYEPDCTKASNYWRCLKRKLKQENFELVSATHGFKIDAPAGKLRMANVLNSESVKLLEKNSTNNLKGCTTLLDKSAQRIFQKAVLPLLIAYTFPDRLQMIERMSEASFNEIMDKYIKMNVDHSFKESNIMNNNKKK